MRAITPIIIMTIACLTANAQQIWTEGTSWEIHSVRTDLSGEEYDDVLTYELGEPISFNDTIYYTLTQTHEGVTNIVSYLRAEEDDSYVYARHFRSEELGIYTGEETEILLYDFSKPFEYGATIRFGTYGGYFAFYYIDPESFYELRYYYDVIETGDCLPAYQDIIYKIGSIHGPIANLFADYVEDAGNNPNTKNVSHVLFKTKGKPGGSMITLRIDIVHDIDNQPNVCYSLSGIRYTANANNRVLFRKENILLMR